MCCPAIAPFLCPMKDRAITGEKFYDCDICGFTYRMSQTTLNSAGLRVCYEHCLDQGDYRFRTPAPYNIDIPILYDANEDTYWQLGLNGPFLVADEIPDLGGFKPGPYVVVDSASGVAYQLIMDNRQLFVESGINGKRYSLLEYQSVVKQLIMSLGYLYTEEVE